MNNSAGKRRSDSATRRNKSKAGTQPRRRSSDRAGEAYQKLRDLIVGGRLAPGTRIIEADVARRLGVSRTPVRSALHRLRHEGYVTESDGSHRAQLTVAPLTKEDGTVLYHLVAEVEGLAVRYAAELDDEPRAELVADLKMLNSNLQHAAQTNHPDGNQYYELDFLFHQRYLDAVDQPRVHALCDAIRPQAERYMHTYTNTLPDHILTSVAEHERIIKALAAGDPAAAQHAVQTNYRNAASRLSRVIDAAGERGSW